uniref:Uncharacterized protein n=1 Tax=Romanomermis culicivorax TaxID=13658 RepID=A0A915L5K5_ROMCU
MNKPSPPNRKLKKQPVKPVLKLVPHCSRKSQPPRQQPQPSKGHLPASQIAIVPVSLITEMTATKKKPNNRHAKTPQALIAINRNAVTMHRPIALEANKCIRCILPVSTNRRTNMVSAAHHPN